MISNDESRVSDLSAVAPLGLDTTFLDAMDEAVLATETDLALPGPRILYCNPAFERMTGWRSDEVLGRSPRILQGPKTDRTVVRSVTEILGRGGTFRGRAVNYRRDGSEFVMGWSITPVPGPDGRPRCYIAVQRDVTAEAYHES